MRQMLLLLVSATRSMNVRHAIWMSAAFNFLGVLVMTHINSSVAATISNMVDFGGVKRTKPW